MYLLMAAWFSKQHQRRSSSHTTAQTLRKETRLEEQEQAARDASKQSEQAQDAYLQSCQSSSSKLIKFLTRRQTAVPDVCQKSRRSARGGTT